jgi:acetolactate synthase-1/2/3 large subunit
LKEENVDTLFGYPGGCVMDIYDEMVRQQIRHILVRHEQGAVHAADGYARASGRVGVCLVTSGPGATNTVTGIANAYMDSIPVVVLTGQVPTAIIGSDGFQEVDITGITRTCTKHNFLVRNIGDLHRTVREAFQIARSGRPGPVLVDLPKDVIQSVTEAELPRIVLPPVEDRSPDLEGLCDETLKMLLHAKKPLIVVGGGVILGKASSLFRAFARKFRIPVVSTLMGLGAFPASDPLWTGMLGMHGAYSANMAVSNCDLLLAIGVRFVPPPRFRPLPPTPGSSTSISIPCRSTGSSGPIWRSSATAPRLSRPSIVSATSRSCRRPSRKPAPGTAGSINGRRKCRSVTAATGTSSPSMWSKSSIN